MLTRPFQSLLLLAGSLLGAGALSGGALLPLTAGTRTLANVGLWVGVGLALVTGAQYLLDTRKVIAAEHPAAPGHAV